MNYEQKLSKFWWLRNANSFAYFVRELTGLFIVFYIIYFLVSAFVEDSSNSFDFLRTSGFKIVSAIGFAAAVIHTLTWLWVMTNFIRKEIKKWQQILLFFLLIGLWIAVSFILLTVFYAK